MHVIGTAGHIDHGKSTLIHALAGTDPDRLKEERSRGMTIDLGFAWVSLPSGREVGMVDVPGHYRFIKNMLAGAGNIDLSLFIVGANEGWMPQTEEHLAILDLLEVRRGIVVLTKKDLVDDDWLVLVREEVADRLAGRSLDGSPVLAVSATAGDGLDALRVEMDRMLDRAPAPRDLSRPHLWVDRVFSVKGAGTVVTGTLADGTLRLDREVRLLPGGKRARVRGLQSHKRTVVEIGPGHRVAVNLAGVDPGEVRRGQALIAAGDEDACFETRRVHAHVRLPIGLDRSLKRAQFVKVYAGTAEVNGRLKPLERQPIEPGARGMVQIELERPLPLRHRDPIIVRDPSRRETPAGGRVADPAAPRVRGERLRIVRSRPGFSPRGGAGLTPTASTGRTGNLAASDWGPAFESLPGVAARELDLDRLRQWTEAPAVRLPELLLESRPYVSHAEIARTLPLSDDELEASLSGMETSGRTVRLPSYWMREAAWNSWADEVKRRLGEHHRLYPLRIGFLRETLRTALKVEERLFEEAIAEGEGRRLWKGDGPYLRLPDHRVSLDADQERERRRLTSLLQAAPYSPPTREQLVGRDGFSDALLSALVEQGRLVKVSRSILLEPPAFEEATQLLLEHIEAHGSVDVAAARDLLQTSRKYALPLLEYLDEIGVTRRVEDRRVVGPRADGRAV